MARDSSKDLLPLSFTCKIHDSVAAHCSCTICDCYICDVCVASGGHNHDSNEHYLLSVSEIFEKEKKFLKSVLTETAKVKQSVCSMISKIEEDIRDDVFRMKKGLKNSIEELFPPQEFRNVEQKKRKFIADIGLMKLEHANRLDAANNFVDKTEKECQKSLKQAEKILEHLKKGKPDEVAGCCEGFEALKEAQFKLMTLDFELDKFRSIQNEGEVDYPPYVELSLVFDAKSKLFPVEKTQHTTPQHTDLIPATRLPVKIHKPDMIINRFRAEKIPGEQTLKCPPISVEMMEKSTIVLTDCICHGFVLNFFIESTEVKLLDTITDNEFPGFGNLRPRSIASFNKYKLLVIDQDNKMIRIDFDSKRLISPKTTSSAVISLKETSAPADIAINTSEVKKPTVFVIDRVKKQIFEYDMAGNCLNSFQLKEFHTPTGIIYHNGYLLVVDYGCHSIFKISTEGQLLDTFMKKGFNQGCLYKPYGIVVLNKEYVAITEVGNNRISIFRTNKKLSFVYCFGMKGSEPGEFWKPKGMSSNSKHLAVADSKNKRVQIFPLDLIVK